jgi:hypothetical protein
MGVQEKEKGLARLPNSSSALVGIVSGVQRLRCVIVVVCCGRAHPQWSSDQTRHHVGYVPLMTSRNRKQMSWSD